MSLLLEALKKAEKAKEEAQRRAREAQGGGEMQLADESAAPGEAKHVVTRAELPEITAPLEILSEDLRADPQQPGSAARELSLQDAAPAAAPRPAQRSNAEAQSAQRATARKVFEAKVREPNPRLPFVIAVGALGAFAVGTVIYFWIQLRPPAPLVNTNPTPSPGEIQVAVAPAAAPAAPQPGAQAPASAAIPGLPSGAPPARAAAPVAPAPQQRATVLATNRPAPHVHPRVESGYAAYQAGRLDAARNDYQQALREEPGNRDAMLGLAAVEMRMQRFEAADALYQRLLQAEPRDPHANAGMLALRSQQLDPVAAESRLKTLLAADPAAAVLHFTLGNQYVQQSRWAEAREAYVRAVAADPDNPDYAYNLAVSLDHLRQTGPALVQYRRALDLALKRNASFDPAAALARAQQLAR
jgi:tetratricopeptide (TPR) repeat protein